MYLWTRNAPLNIESHPVSRSGMDWPCGSLRCSTCALVLYVGLIYSINGVLFCEIGLLFHSIRTLLIGVATIFSGGALSYSKKLKIFLVVGLKTQAKTTKLTTPAVQISPISAKIGLLLSLGCTCNFPCKFCQKILRFVGAREPSALLATPVTLRGAGNFCTSEKNVICPDRCRDLAHLAN